MPELKTVEVWAQSKAIDALWFAMAKAYFRWPVGRELSEADFDAAIARVQSIRVR